GLTGREHLHELVRRRALQLGVGAGGREAVELLGRLLVGVALRQARVEDVRTGRQAQGDVPCLDRHAPRLAEPPRPCQGSFPGSGAVALETVRTVVYIS